jgi:uncharacterized protein YlxW (UPF0749 family)
MSNVVKMEKPLVFEKLFGKRIVVQFMERKGTILIASSEPTDVDWYDLSYPFEVVQVGDEVTKVDVGDRVSVVQSGVGIKKGKKYYLTEESHVIGIISSAPKSSTTPQS